MFNHLLRRSWFLMILTCFSTTNLYTESNGPELTDAELLELVEMAKQGAFDNDDFDDCSSTSLRLSKLCAKLIRAGCIQSGKVVTRELCAELAKINIACVKSFNTDSINTNTFNAQLICTTTLNAKHAFVEDMQINEICAGIANANLFNAEQINANQICSQIANIENLQVDVAQFNNLCSEVAYLKELLADQILTNSLCARQANVANLCADVITTQTLSVTGQVINCNNLLAEVGFATTSAPYTLGTTVNFDTTIFDPNGNISLVPFTSYTVPVTGIYVATVQLDSMNLDGPTIIGGVPIGEIDILVNGVVRRKTFTPYLSFLTEQQSNLTCLILLNAGDQVTVSYEVLILTASSGLISYPGTVTFVGGPGDNAASLFTINYLSSTCSSSTNSCMTNCPTVTLPCQTVTLDCSPVQVSCPQVSVGCAAYQPVVCTPCTPCAPPICPC